MDGREAETAQATREYNQHDWTQWQWQLLGGDEPDSSRHYHRSDKYANHTDTKTLCSHFPLQFVSLAFHKMKASLKGRYDTDKSSAATSVAFSAGDVRLRASMTDATIINGPSLNGLVLSVEKPGAFIVDYDVPRKDFRFQFMNTVRVVDKPLNLTYVYSRGDSRTVIDGTLVFDPANKLSANHMLGSGNCKVKYTYLHAEQTLFEPCYDIANNAWDFGVSWKVYGDDTFKATYQTTTKALALEWSRTSKFNGFFKVCAALNLADEKKVPKLTAESTWNFEM